MSGPLRKGDLAALTEASLRRRSTLHGGKPLWMPPRRSPAAWVPRCCRYAVFSNRAFEPSMHGLSRLLAATIGISVTSGGAGYPQWFDAASCRISTSSDLNYRPQPVLSGVSGTIRLRWFVGVKVAAGDDLWCLALQRSLNRGRFPRRSSEAGFIVKIAFQCRSLARAIGFARAEAALDAFEVSGSA